jgi:regulator of replication initiation timing
VAAGGAGRQQARGVEQAREDAAQQQQGEAADHEEQEGAEDGQVEGSPLQTQEPRAPQRLTPPEPAAPRGGDRRQAREAEEDDADMGTSGNESASHNTADRDLAAVALRQSVLLTNKNFSLEEENRELHAQIRRLRKENRKLRADNDELEAKLGEQDGRAEQQSGAAHSSAAPTQEDAEEVDAADEARRRARDERVRLERRAERERAARNTLGFETAREFERRTSGAQQGGGTGLPQYALQQAQWNQRERERKAEEHARKRQRTGGDAEPIAQGMSGVIARPPPPGAGTRAPVQGVPRSSTEVARSSSEVAQGAAQGAAQATFIPLGQLEQFNATSYTQ